MTQKKSNPETLDCSLPMPCCPEGQKWGLGEATDTKMAGEPRGYVCGRKAFGLFLPLFQLSI